ncbi:putative hydrolase [Gordonia effusa NBRC 100432]|uniref:Putative hydrolase n=1 Tax=Gordonia effusa NBRC 100432 TaxID=1077974 RepID=H0QWU6_9ACTN|nr:CocE/NonD family hydrolase [Gordonia effusa]GAB17297.1 putative hydrolase [Gordonia effusa NBRC 100432]
MHLARRDRNGRRKFDIARSSFSVVLVAGLLLGLSVLATPAVASAAPVGPANRVPVGDGLWTAARIPSTGGVTLYADVLRPRNLPANAKTPVVMAIGPYFNHFAKPGEKGNAQDGMGRGLIPANRYDDLIAGANLLKRGYTVVMVDLRGYGGSSGCPDAAGPSEQSDVASAVRWAANQPWSTGKVGLYGKSYDAVTALMGAGMEVPGLSAAVAQEPVYDWYRYLYGNGVPRVNRLGTPLSFVYLSTGFSPVPGMDLSSYFERSFANFVNPSCLTGGLLAQLNSRKSDAYWRARNLLPRLRGSAVPLFLSQGFIDQNTSADGLEQALAGMRGPVRAWLGMWDHVRGNDTDMTALLNSGTPKRLSTGRAGYLQEVGRFFDAHLKGKPASTSDPNFVIQDNTGRWRAQQNWPQSTSTRTATLRAGSYIYDGRQTATKIFYQGRYYATQLDSVAPGGNNFQVAKTADAASNGVWTVLAPEASNIRLSGTIKVSLTTTAPVLTPVAIDVYDVDETGTGTLITQNAAILGPRSTSVSLFSTDWVVAAGHRLAIRVTDSNTGRWGYDTPTNARVVVKGGTVTLPLAPVDTGSPTPGGSNSNLEGYLGSFRYPVPSRR